MHDIDQNTLLCFACSASLPPNKKSSSSPSASPSVFTTPCCQRLICNKCITANPRLQRYNPCLACLGGVGIMRSPSSGLAGTRPNLDGAVRDEDTFVLGDEDYSDCEQEQGLDATALEADTFMSTTVPPVPPVAPVAKVESTTLEDKPMEPPVPKYHIAPSDTLQGIVLRFGLDGHEVCRLNNLPFSTLRTTPHLLHTRHYLILPPSSRQSGLPIGIETPEQEATRKADREKEKAEKKLQTMVKEVDWRVAKAYVALADDDVEELEERERWERKRKEMGGDGPTWKSNLQERAIARYLDDDEWEAQQRGGKASSTEKGGPIRKWWS